MSKLDELKKLALRGHYSCEDDCFYSCPLDEEYCGTSDVKECKCGADEHNAEVERIFKELKKYLREPEESEEGEASKTLNQILEGNEKEMSK